MGVGERYLAYTQRALDRRPHDLALYRAAVARHTRSGARALHFGCGWDRSGVAAQLAAAGAEVHGLDVDPEVAERYPQRFWLTNGGRLPFADRSFDLVCSEYVFEHVADPRAVMAELARVLRPGGHLVALTPNRWSYKSLVAAGTPHWFHRLVAGRLRPDARDPGDVYPTHYRMNTPGALRHLAAFHGLSVVDLLLINNGPTWFRKLPGVFEAGRVLHRAMDLAPLAGLRCGILVTLRRREPWSGAPPSPADAPLVVRCTACAHDPMDATAGGFACPECGHRYVQRGRVVDTRAADPNRAPQAAPPT